jgi:hypothetical protein
MTETNDYGSGSSYDDLELDGDLDNKNSSDSSSEELVQISKKKLIMFKKMLLNIKESNDKLTQLVSSYLDAGDEKLLAAMPALDSLANTMDGDSRIIEGVFDGENMIGGDGKQYSIPANYASKSKLIEGDVLKLTIAPNGSFVYKQIGPIDRKRVVGKLVQMANGNFYVENEDKRWKVLTASVTYYRGSSGDEVIILVPKVSESNWAAVDNIVRNEAI